MYGGGGECLVFCCNVYEVCLNGRVGCKCVVGEEDVEVEYVGVCCGQVEEQYDSYVEDQYVVDCVYDGKIGKVGIDDIVDIYFKFENVYDDGDLGW